MDDHYLDDFYDDDIAGNWIYQHAPEHAPVGGPVCQHPDDPIIIPGYTLDDQGVWQPPDDQSPSPPGLFESADDYISAETLGLPGRLADRLKRHQRGVTSRRAHSLDDTFFATEHATPPEEEGESVAPHFPPEAPSRVAAEVCTVEHMLSTAILWMSTVDPSTLSPDVQERLASLTAQAFRTACLFPTAQEVLENSTMLPEGSIDDLEAVTASGSTTSPVEAPSAPTQRRRRRRPRRN